MLTPILLVVVMVLIVAVVMSGARRGVPWSAELRRMKAGVAQQAEWMAPDDVVEQVRTHYIEATNWLQDSAFLTWQDQRDYCTAYLAGKYLQQYRERVEHLRAGKTPTLVGVLRADHHVDVRQFNETGEQCYIVDSQTARRMATYQLPQVARLHTQDLGESTLVFRMCYDLADKRWKIAELVQELPRGWNYTHAGRWVRIQTELPSRVGKDA